MTDPTPVDLVKALRAARLIIPGELAREAADAIEGLEGELANERRKASQLLIAANIWQGRAEAAEARVKVLVGALIRLRDCDWTIGRGDRMDPVRDIARNALNPQDGEKG